MNFNLISDCPHLVLIELKEFGEDIIGNKEEFSLSFKGFIEVFVCILL